MPLSDSIFVTGGAGFIGSNFVLQWLAQEEAPVVVLDKLSYAGNMENLASAESDNRFSFVLGDIVDGALVRDILQKQCPRAIVHFAAQTHVDRSILGPGEFIRTNIEGTYELLETARRYWAQLAPEEKSEFRFLHISTDEVYGSLSAEEPASTETTRYAPNSPYSASKASSDHLVHAYYHTYGLPVLTTHSSNNYGPRQFPEKLIPLMVLNAMEGVPLPVYGDGQNVRDWLYVADHCNAIRTVLKAGRPGESYNIGGRQQMTNCEVVRLICQLLDELKPVARPYSHLIKFVTDRPGHDRRYALDISKIETELGWRPSETFATGLRKTVQWYLANLAWVEHVTSGEYREWINLQYATSV